MFINSDTYKIVIILAPVHELITGGANVASD